jgi:hypothetical protein
MAYVVLGRRGWSLSWITLYKMMVEINKYEEKLMLLEMEVDDGGMMV